MKIITVVILSLPFLVWIHSILKNKPKTTDEMSDAEYVHYLKDKIMIRLRGDREKFERLYQTEKGKYPDYSEIEILERMLDDFH